jgi:hypothetical protein
MTPTNDKKARQTARVKPQAKTASRVPSFPDRTIEILVHSVNPEFKPSELSWLIDKRKAR